MLDAGCGNGAATLCLAHRLPSCRIVGLDIQKDMVDLCRRNIALNAMGDRVSSVTGDISTPPFSPTEHAFDCIMTNPPFLPAGRGTTPPDKAKARAHIEKEASLPEWLSACVSLLRPKGSLCLIHRADRLGDIIGILAPMLGELQLFPLWPKQGRAAKRILVCGRKGVASPSAVHAGLILHRDDGSYTPEADAILRDGQGIAL